MSKKDIPVGWVRTTFADLFTTPKNDVVDGPFGSNLKASEYVPSGIPIARLQNIDRNKFIPKNTKYVTKEKAEDLERHTFIPNDILITKLGIPLGKACLAPENIKKGVLVADVVRARITHNWVDVRYLCHLINSHNVIEQFKSLTKGTTRPRVNLTKIRSLDVVLCPLSEQKRIVEKLEEVLSVQGNAVTELKAAQTKLTQYRQSLLISAVEGTLTQQWRETHKLKETGAQLLEHILKERLQRWEQQKLEEFKEKGKAPPKDWQKKYPEPVKPVTSDLSELPDGWVWATIDQVADVGTGVTPLKSRNDYYLNGQIPWVTSGAVNKEFVTEASSMVTEVALNECRLKLYPVGTLLVAMYGEGKTRGKCSELRIQATINQALAALVFEGASAECKELLKIFLLGSYEKMRSQASGGVQPNLNLQILKNIPFPIPPVSEQNVIVETIKKQLDIIEKQQEDTQTEIMRSKAQEKNILKSAFSGELVVQDPNDEPASVLLERIKAERDERAKQPKPKRVKKKLSEVENLMETIREVLMGENDWIDAQEAFRRCGVSDGTDSERIEELYAELRRLDKEKVLDKKRVGDYDQLKLKNNK